MAERGTALLRAYYKEAGIQAGCPDEVDFNEMYAALGDAKAQDLIRQQKPDAVHCVLLLTSATACDGCPKNPHQPGDQQNKELLEKNAMLIQRCFEILGNWEMGAVASAQLSPVEFSLLQITYHARHQHQQETQAKLMAFELGKIVAQIMGRIFGVKNG